MRFVVSVFSFVLMLFITATGVLAVQPDEILQDKALETRARAISKELRCMVCQNQSIDDSEAPLAKDLRVLVRDTSGGSGGFTWQFTVGEAQGEPAPGAVPPPTPTKQSAPAQQQPAPDPPPTPTKVSIPAPRPPAGPTPTKVPAPQRG